MQKTKRAIVSLTAIVFVVLVIFLTGCNSSGNITPASPNTPTPTPVSPNSGTSSFSVSSTVPASGATQVAPDATIQIVFSGPINTATVTATNIQVTNPKPVAGALSYNAATYTVTFTPSAALTSSTTYTVGVNGITSSSGTALTAPFSTTFTTAPPPTATTLQYEAPITGGTPTGPNGTVSVDMTGEVSVDTKGNVTLQMMGATVSTTYSFEFCPSYSIYNGRRLNPGIALGTVTSSASGAINSSVPFPQAGNWAGEFQLNSGSEEEAVTGLSSSNKNPVYMSTLEPELTISLEREINLLHRRPRSPAARSCLAMRTIPCNLRLTALRRIPVSPRPSAEFWAARPATRCTTASLQSQFTTNAQGNVSFTVEQDGMYGDIFLTEPPSCGSGFIGGFTVPKNIGGLDNGSV